MTIVIEEDGTEVTSDEELCACHGTILLALQHEEAWLPDHQDGLSHGDVEGVASSGRSYGRSTPRSGSEVRDSGVNYSSAGAPAGGEMTELSAASLEADVSDDVTLSCGDIDMSDAVKL